MIDPDWRKIAETLNELSEQYGVGKVELELRRIFAPLLSGVPASVLVQAGLSESEAGAGSRSGDSQQTVQGDAPSPPRPTGVREDGTLDHWDTDVPKTIEMIERWRVCKDGYEKSVMPYGVEPKETDWHFYGKIAPYAISEMPRPRRPNLDIWDDNEWFIKSHPSLSNVIEKLRARTDDLKNRLEDLEAKFQ